MTSEHRYYFRDYIPDAKECPCYIKSMITTSPFSTETDRGSKFTTNLSLCIFEGCKWHYKNKLENLK